MMGVLPLLNDWQKPPLGFYPAAEIPLGRLSCSLQALRAMVASSRVWGCSEPWIQDS